MATGCLIEVGTAKAPKMRRSKVNHVRLAEFASKVSDAKVREVLEAVARGSVNPNFTYDSDTHSIKRKITKSKTLVIDLSSETAPKEVEVLVQGNCCISTSNANKEIHDMMISRPSEPKKEEHKQALEMAIADRRKK